MRGVTRARSLPVPGTEGRGGGGRGRGGLCRLPRESSGRPRTKLRSQTQTIDPGPCLTLTDQDTPFSADDGKRDTGDKMAGGVGDIRAVGRGLVTSQPEAPPPDVRDVTASLRAPPSGRCARASSGGIRSPRAGRAGRRRPRCCCSCSPSPAEAGTLSRNLSRRLTLIFPAGTPARYL